MHWLQPDAAAGVGVDADAGAGGAEDRVGSAAPPCHVHLVLLPPDHFPLRLNLHLLQCLPAKNFIIKHFVILLLLFKILSFNLAA